MWNINLKRGTIWSVKSINQYDDYYEGMTGGTKNILILSVFTDSYGKEAITYIKVSNHKKENKDYLNYIINNKIYYFDINNLYTGERLALESYVDAVPPIYYNQILKAIKSYFNLENKKESKIKEESKKIEEEEVFQRRIYKFGIDVYITENEHVQITKGNRILLSNCAKEDIIYNSKTDEELRILCDKYKIYPIKAIKEIRNRLLYQHRQKEG